MTFFCHIVIEHTTDMCLDSTQSLTLPGDTILFVEGLNEEIFANASGVNHYYLSSSGITVFGA